MGRQIDNSIYIYVEYIYIYIYVQIYIYIFLHKNTLFFIGYLFHSIPSLTWSYNIFINVSDFYILTFMFSSITYIIFIFFEVSWYVFLILVSVFHVEGFTIMTCDTCLFIYI